MTTYTISVCGYGANNVASSFAHPNLFQGERRHVFQDLRTYLIEHTKRLEKECGCFDEFTFFVNVIVTTEEWYKTAELEIDAEEILTYREGTTNGRKNNSGRLQSDRRDV